MVRVLVDLYYGSSLLALLLGGQSAPLAATSASALASGRGSSVLFGLVVTVCIFLGGSPLFLTFLVALPCIFRFLQCLRAYMDSPHKQSSHLWNAGNLLIESLRCLVFWWYETVFFQVLLRLLVLILFFFLVFASGKYISTLVTTCWAVYLGVHVSSWFQVFDSDPGIPKHHFIWY